MTILSSYSDFRYAFSQTKAIGNDGYEVYPSSLVRANGFDAGFTNLPTRAPTVPFSFPLVFYISGNVAGPPAYRAYLSQRRESSSPLFTLIEDPASIGGGRSRSAPRASPSLGASWGHPGKTRLTARPSSTRCVNTCTSTFSDLPTSPSSGSISGLRSRWVPNMPRNAD